MREVPCFCPAVLDDTRMKFFFLSIISMLVCGCATNTTATRRSNDGSIPFHHVTVLVTEHHRPVDAFLVDFRIVNVSDSKSTNQLPGKATLCVNETAFPCKVLIDNPVTSSLVYHCAFDLPAGVLKDESVSFELDTCEGSSLKHQKKY